MNASQTAYRNQQGAADEIATKNIPGSHETVHESFNLYNLSGAIPMVVRRGFGSLHEASECGQEMLATKSASKVGVVRIVTLVFQAVINGKTYDVVNPKNVFSYGEPNS